MIGRILPDLTPRPPAMPPGRSGRDGRPARVTVAAVRALWNERYTVEEMMAELNCSRGTIEKRKREAGLVVTRAQRAERRQEARSAAGGPGTGRVSRHAPHLVDRTLAMPPVGHPALAEGRTLYPSTVVPVDGLKSVLVSGANSHKIGDVVRKGRWKGFPIYTVTFEERRTCPTSCILWRSCYGNHMHFARRIIHGPAFERRLGHELAVLASRHAAGFAVRLHVLGDFYSVGYVGLWRGFLDALPPLHVFGFTARSERDDPIAVALVELALERWDRFALRFSNAPVDECSTVTIEHPLQKPADAILCPQQVGRTASCATCALCWQSRRRIAFLRH